MSEIDLNSPEIKDAIAAAVDAEVKGLKAKNGELIDQIKKLRKQTEIDPADLAAVEEERDALKQQLAEANKAVKKATGDLEAANKRAEQAEGSMTSLLVDNGLSEALAKAGVTNPVHMKAAKALLAGQVAVADDNGTKVVKAGDKPLADYITEWAQGDEGKHFVSVPDTTGGGSQGGRGGSNSTGDMGGSRDERKAAIASRFNLPK